MSLRVAGAGDISPVDGVAENSEFWALAGKDIGATARSHNTGPSRPRKAAVADPLIMTRLFSAEIEAISSRASPVCGLIDAVVGASPHLSETSNARRFRAAEDPPFSKTNRACRPRPNGIRDRHPLEDSVASPRSWETCALAIHRV